ncbi:hypothetical protein TWF281_003398 [Arthrobotrys megalospora]
MWKTQSLIPDYDDDDLNGPKKDTAWTMKSCVHRFPVYVLTTFDIYGGECSDDAHLTDLTRDRVMTEQQKELCWPV